MVDFDGKAREWDTNPAFVERGRQVAEAIRALVRLYPGVRAVDGLSVVVRLPAAHWPAGVPLPAGGEERTGQIELSCDKVPPLLACLERGTRLEPGHAAPLSPLELLSAQVLSRLMVVLGASLIVYLGASLSLGFPMHGSYTALALVFTAGSLCLIGIGLVVAARPRTEELADGIISLVSWPMLLLSGLALVLLVAAAWMFRWA